MKKLICSFVLVAFTLASCNDNEIEQKQTVQEPIPPTFISKLPCFNSDALYVVGREYETLKDGTSQKSSKFRVKGKVVSADSLTLFEYIEMRLIELYPDKAYVGMSKDIEDEGTFAMQMYNDYLAQRKVWEESQGIYQEEHEIEEITSTEKLIEVMNPSTEELELIQSLDSLATGATYATTNDFENILKVKGSSDIRKSSQSIVGVVLISVGVIAAIGVTEYLVAKMCERRTYNKLYEFYGTRSPLGGSKEDAFKHTCVSMLLCSYLTQPSAWLIMDVYYENANPNKPCDKYMDLHNNSVGRHWKFWSFRGSYFGDMFKWEKWTKRVYNYIENSDNGIKMDWNVDTVESTVKSDESDANNYKYIYWNPN
ncbi:MAG: hypothetical protein PHH37_05710 [Paludibacter sp.]|nr:hypothetical protein [Paludibacter sp.]